MGRLNVTMGTAEVRFLWTGRPGQRSIKESIRKGNNERKARRYGKHK